MSFLLTLPLSGASGYSQAKRALMDIRELYLVRDTGRSRTNMVYELIQPIFLEASPIRYLPAEIKIGKLTVGRKEFSMATLIEMIKTSVREIGAKRIVVDPVTTLVFQYEGVAAQRNALVELMEALADTGATCLITTELRRPGFERSIDYEEYLAHGVILLQQLQVGKSLLRVIQVEKMRKTPLVNQPRPYRITDTGIEVFPRESVL